jgi:hypothetical protein
MNAERQKTLSVMMCLVNTREVLFFGNIFFINVDRQNTPKMGGPKMDKVTGFTTRPK